MEINRPYGVAATHPPGAITLAAWKQLTRVQQYHQMLLKSLADTPNYYAPILAELIKDHVHYVHFTFPLHPKNSILNEERHMRILAVELPLITSFLRNMEESCPK